MREWIKDNWYALVALLFVAGVLIGGVFVVVKTYDDLAEYERKMEECIGSEIVVGNDTLVVVNYGHWSGKFILSNGVAVDQEIVFDNMLIK